MARGAGACVKKKDNHNNSARGSGWPIKGQFHQRSIMVKLLLLYWLVSLQKGYQEQGEAVILGDLLISISFLFLFYSHECRNLCVRPPGCFIQQFPEFALIRHGKKCKK